MNYLMDPTVIIEAFDTWTENTLSWINDHGGWVFDSVRLVLEGIYGGILWTLMLAPFYIVAVLLGLFTAHLLGKLSGILAALGLTICALMGLWNETMQTFGLVISATALTLLLGIPLGIAAGYSPSLDRFVAPLLNLLQTLPPYIYLLPAIALLGYGAATAISATIIVAMPPVVRLTALGIRLTPIEHIELGKVSGLKPWHMFSKIRLPFAVPSIMVGINQSLMVAFGMVVIAGLVGSGGLGDTVYSAMRTLNIGLSVNAAIAIVILTIILDRLAQQAAHHTSRNSR